MRRYTYIRKINTITGTTTIQRYRSTNGIHRSPDRQVSETDPDYRYCLENVPDAITDEDVTEQERIQRRQQNEEHGNQLLSETDWAMLPDVVPRVMTQEKQDEIRAYRQQVYDTKNSDDPFSVTWPLVPNLNTAT